MALKKSELYSSLWASCDELRGSMDASQYKDYVLVLLFVKYISDRYADEPYAPISIPKGATFADMVALKGKTDIGDQINKKILGPLAQANHLSDMPDFNDPAKLGDGKERVEKLTSLIAIFEDPALDFSKNRADGDDLLGDAYEYLMRHFATESGKSKGQFYTPAEVSRVIAQILGIRHAKISNDTTVYDPTCGSGSLLLKIGDEARHGHQDVKVTLYGQEKDNATAGLARMNMILHDYAIAEIKQGNTLASPLFLDGDALKTFDYVVANPPFSDKRWSTGLDAEHDPWQRFHYGVPPGKQGDYAYLLPTRRTTLRLPGPPMQRMSRSGRLSPAAVTRRDSREVDRPRRSFSAAIDFFGRGRCVQLLLGLWVALAQTRAPAPAIAPAPAAAPATAATPAPTAAPAVAATPPAAQPSAPAYLGNPNALGLARTVEIDTSGGPGFGFEHFRMHDFPRINEVLLTFDDGPWPDNTPVASLAV